MYKIGLIVSRIFASAKEYSVKITKSVYNSVASQIVQLTKSTKNGLGSEKEPTKKRNYRRPDVAWPTIYLFSLSTLGTILVYLVNSGILFPYDAREWLITSVLGDFYYITNQTVVWCLLDIPLGVLSLILLSAFCYAQFTVTHDAIHGSVSKNKTVNDAIGSISQMWLGPTSNWYGIKYNHLKHHTYTNDSSRDPDYWCSLEGPGGKYLLPLRWLTIDMSYLMNYFTYIIAKFKVDEFMFMVGYGTIVWWCLYYYTTTLLFYWVIPSRVAMFLLAAAFDFMPHYPHHITKKEDKYKTTSFITTTWYLRPILSLLIFYQNYHIAHHLNPVVPFYMYSTIWDQMKEKVLSQHEIEILKILPVLN